MERGFAELHGIDDALQGVQLHGRSDPAIIRDAFERRLARSPSAAEIDEIIDRLLINLRIELLNLPGYRVLPGVREILEKLSQQDDTLLGLETGNTQPGAEMKLSHGGIWHYFCFGGYGTDSDIRSEIVQAGIKRAEQLLGGDDHIDEIWVVGDTPLDIEAGKAVGGKTLATATGMHSLDLLKACDPDLAVSDLSDVRIVTATLLGKT